MRLTQEQITQFHDTLREYYAKHARHDLPWRIAEPDGHFDFYKILVSEIMLQQTQVNRVVPKFRSFISLFPTVDALASASLGSVLQAWQGLGYNRRAKFLWQSAQKIIFGGIPDDLTELPGVGSNTAGAIMTYTFNKPVLFIETNIRTVYIHHFARGVETVPDSLIRSLLAQTLGNVSEQENEPTATKSQSPITEQVKKEGLSNYRDFYWALMDYGSYLKINEGNVSRRSKHYAKQTAFNGSKRQIRGAVIRALSSKPHTVAELNIQDERVAAVLSELLDEGLIYHDGTRYCL